MTSAEYGFTSSTITREVANLGGDISNLVPEDVSRRIKKKLETKKLDTTE
jgi:pantetheine-phosphate adenylyltransferase